jgi:hypothetical protein
MKTRRVSGFALPSTGVDLLHLDDGVGVVLADGRMVRANGRDAPAPVLGPGPRPVAVSGTTVLTIDGATCTLGALDARNIDLDATALVDVFRSSDCAFVVNESGHLCRFGGNGITALLTNGVDRVFGALDDRVLVQDEAGVHVLDANTGHRRWSRPSRGSTGERASAACLLPDGVAIAREAHGLDGLEDESELELWQDGSMRACLRLSDVAHVLTWTKSGLVVADMSGGVHLCVNDALTPVHRGTSSALDVVDLAGQWCVASWFNVLGFDGTELLWTVEHAGMPQRLLEREGLLFMVGDDGNDWTGVEPLGCIDVNGEPVEVEPGELTLWFPAPAPERIDEVEFVPPTQDLDEGEPAEAWRPPAGLMDALTADVHASIAHDSVDESDLLQALTDPSPSTEAVPFHVDGGGDRRLHVDGQGAAEVLLEPVVTGAPAEGVVFSWLDAQGRELGSRPRLLLKLPIGVHRFDVRVRHPDGRWVMDTVTVDVRPASG